MKTSYHLLTAALLIGTISLLTACGKEQVSPYIPSESSDIPESQEIKYSSSGYSEEGVPSEESLESATYNTGDQLSASGMDKDSDEYKKQFGRSSEQLLPIYFDFDQASIRSDQIPRLEQNAEYLKNNPSAKVVIEGNCDERGTNEYNLALGERRALNAKTYLIELGLDDYRIRTVSYGEERPLFFDQDEFSWSQNRRDDFTLE